MPRNLRTRGCERLSCRAGRDPLWMDEAKGAALSGQRRGIQSVEIGMGLLDALIRLGKPSSLSEIAKASGLSVSQAHRYLASFVNTGFLRQDSVSLEYDLHSGALRLGLAAMARMDVFEAAGRVAQLLVAQTGRTILLAVWAEQGPTVVRWYPGDPPIYTTLAIGSRLPLAGSATGHVFLTFQQPSFTAAMRAAEVQSDRGAKELDFDAISQRVRRALIAEIDSTVIPGLRAFAVPVFNLQGDLSLVISMIASSGFDPAKDGEASQQLLQAAQDLTLSLGGRWPK